MNTKDPGVKLDDVDKAFAYLLHIKQLCPTLGDRHLLNAKRICLGLRRHPHAIEDAFLVSHGW